MNIIPFIKRLAHNLKPVYPEKELAEQAAWHIIEQATNKKRAKLIQAGSLSLTLEQQRLINHWIEQHVVHHKPLQYLFGTVPFCSAEIIIEPPILIPRSETEQWCMTLIEQLRPFAKQRLSILDLCTGSGCLAVAIAREYPHFDLFAVDIAPHTLALAQKNAAHNKVDSITFIQSNLFTQIDPSVTFDLIISNPPYISFQEWRTLEKSVTEWEDFQALVAPEEGLALITSIIKQAAAFIKPTSILKNSSLANVWIEIGYLQKQAVVEFMKNNLYSTIQVLIDEAGKERVVTGNAPHVAITTPE